MHLSNAGMGPSCGSFNHLTELDNAKPITDPKSKNIRLLPRIAEKAATLQNFSI